MIAARENTTEERKAKADLLREHGWMWSPALSCYVSPKASAESQPILFPTDILNESIEGLREYIIAADTDAAHAQEAFNGMFAKVRITHSDTQGIRQ